LAQVREGSHQPTECPCSNHTTVDKIPQKTMSEATGTQASAFPEFWGIVARERHSFVTVAVYVIVAVAPSIAFFFYWCMPSAKVTNEESLANRRDNLSNAAVPLGISITFLMALLALLKEPPA
jgi:hypothetical protein